MREDEARCLLGVLPDLVVLTEADGTITWVSDGGPPSLGWEPDHIIGTSVFDLFAVAADRPVHLRALAGVLAHPGLHGPIEVTVVAADGRLREMEIMVTNALADPDVGRLVAECRDITGRDWELEHIRQSEAWSTSLLRNTSDLLLVCDRQGGIAYVAPSVERVLGLAPSDIGRQSLYAMVHRDDLLADPESGQSIDRVIGTGPGLRPVLRFRHADGGWRRLRVQRTVSLEDPGGDRTVLLTCRDITEDEVSSILLTDQAILLEQIARGAPIADSLYAIEELATDRLSDGQVCIGYVDPDRGTVWEAPGLDPALVAALTEAGLGPLAPAPKLVAATLRRDDDWDSLVRSGSGQRFRAAWFTDLVSAESKLIGRFCVLREHDLALNAAELDLLGRASDLASIAVERHDLQIRLAHGAMHDELTRLPNRRYLLARLRDLFGESDARGGLLFVDLDRFKFINDSLGHDAGDQVLQEVTRRFRRTVRSVDIVARVGGDEFVVVCPDLDDTDAVTLLASRLTSVLKEPIALNEGRVEISASIGVVHVVGPAPAADVLQDADLAMYEAKKQGRDGTAVFHEGLRDRARVRMEMEQALREARRREEMRLYFQPMVRLRDGLILGVEALLRWERPGFGLMLPDDFVPVATETGLILPLGRWVIEQAAAAAARWPQLEMAANLSARQLTDVGLVDFVAEVLQRNQVAPERFCLEITEADLSTDIELMSEQLDRLAALGVRLAIDDFGTGFATLDYLRRFSSAHVLKVDASFVAGLGDPSLPDVAIVSAALVLAEKLNFDTVAEGVETEEQRRVLLGLGCQRAQGFLFSPPVTAAEIDDLLAATDLVT